MRGTTSATLTPVIASIDAVPMIGDGGGSNGPVGGGSGRPPEPPSEKIRGVFPGSTVEAGIKLSDGIAMQKSLCVAVQDGNFGGADPTNPTRIAIGQFYIAKHNRVSQSITDINDVRDILNRGTCFTTPKVFRNAFEHFRFTNTAGLLDTNAVRSLHKRLQQFFINVKTRRPEAQISADYLKDDFGNGRQIVDQTREAIGVARDQLPGLGDERDRKAMTPKLWERIGQLS